MDRFFGLDKVTAHDENAALLTTVHDPVELGLVQSILEGEGIPCTFRERGSGSTVKVIAGYSMVGTDVFVPKARHAEAEELLDAYRNGEIVDDDFELPCDEV